MRLILALKIAPFPCFNKFVPCKWIENILWCNLAGVSKFFGVLLHVLLACFPAIGGQGSHKGFAGSIIVVAAGNGYFIVGHFGIYKIPLKLLPGGPGPYYGSREVYGILH